MKEYLLDRKNFFIGWIGLRGGKKFTGTLIQLYNKVLLQLEAEYDAMVMGMARRFNLELKLLRRVLALKKKVSSLERKLQMRDEDHSRELDTLRKKLDQIQDCLEEEKCTSKVIVDTLKKFLEITKD